MPQSSYDVVAVGTGFATVFFLDGYLRAAPPGARVLVLERGRRLSHADRLAGRRRQYAEERRAYSRRSPANKPWLFTFGLGGTSLAWWGNAPRMMPSDFRLRSRYGVGEDWPLGYDDLEPYYCRAEEAMAISGPDDAGGLFPRSRPYPQPPHRFSRADQVLKSAWPDFVVQQPSARPVEPPPDGRPVCCRAGVCHICPVDSRWSVTNAMAALFEDPRVELRLEAEALAVETTANVATGVTYRHEGREATASGDLVVLGANAIFNPFLLLRSGLDGPQVGRGLVEQASREYLVYLDGLDNLPGSTSITALAFNFYDGRHRRERAAAMIELISLNSFHRPRMRSERGRWLQLLRLKPIVEDLRQPGNRVAVSSANPERPVAVFDDYSDYAHRGLEAMDEAIERFVAPLPVERIELRRAKPISEAHILGTTVMGTDPATSVVDPDSVHHRVRNLVVLGSSTFPTAAPANPTLTLVALALRSAERLTGARPEGAS